MPVALPRLVLLAAGAAAGLALGLWAGPLAHAGLRQASIRSLREVPAERARGWVESGEARLVRAPGPSLEGALAAAGRRALAFAVVVGDDHASALRAAAALSRAGVPRVAVVRGGRAAWMASRGPALARVPEGG